MQQLFYLVSLLACLAAGIVWGLKTRLISAGLLRRLTFAALYLLVFSIGFRIGRTEEVASGFARVGLLALVYALATVGGTVAVLLLLFSLASRRASGRAKAAVGGRGQRPRDGLAGLEWRILKDPLRLLAVLILGCAAGFAPVLPGFRGDDLTTWVLYALLVLIGISVSRSGISPVEIFSHPDLLLLPAGTIVGSLAGGLLVALLLHQRPGEALAVSAGFGWYSLSGVLLAELGDPTLGAVAFLANMFREVIALLLVPLLARSAYPHIGIGVAGATSVDVTLPLIEMSCGPRAVPLALSFGGLISLCVPVLVPLLFQIG
jgi:uncharacterized membrane protein YbjE (DUF340 family)